MITVHYLEKSRAHRIIWLLEELKVPYKIEVYRRDPKTMLALEPLKKIHPTGKSPIIVDGDDVVAESGIICDYLVDKYGQNTDFAPRDKVEARQINYGVTVSESNFMIAGMQLLVFRAAKSKAPWGLSYLVGLVTDRLADAFANKEFALNLQLLNDTLKANNGYYVNGRLTAADIMFETNIQIALTYKLLSDLDQYPEISKWVKMLSEREAYKAAEQKEKEIN